MQTGFNKFSQPGSGDGVWFMAAIAAGIIWGFSVEPLSLPYQQNGADQLHFYGWMLVSLLCLCLGMMYWMLLYRQADIGLQAMVLKPGPLTVMAMPARSAGPMPQPAPASEPEPVSEPQPQPPVDPDASLQNEAEAPAEKPLRSENSDPFLAALDYLGHAHATVRIGGVLALERLVRQGGDLHACVGTLSAYVQQWADCETRHKRPGYDVGAALAVLTRLLPSGDALRNLADLRRANLAGLELTDADMSYFHLEHSDLSGADLRGCNFNGVNFRGADLRGAQLAGASFSGASLRGADLTGAILSDDEYGAADFSMAGNVSAAQLQHVRYHPARPPRLPAGMQLPNQTSAVAV